MLDKARECDKGVVLLFSRYILLCYDRKIKRAFVPKTNKFFCRDLNMRTNLTYNLEILSLISRYIVGDFISFFISPRCHVFVDFYLIFRH